MRPCCYGLGKVLIRPIPLAALCNGARHYGSLNTGVLCSDLGGFRFSVFKRDVVDLDLI
jgi:hypothetical protein